MDLTPAEKKAAALKAEAALNAAGDIDQAGRGLALVMDNCRTNTVDLNTIKILSVIQGYLSSAMTALLTGMSDDEIKGADKPGTGLLLPPGA